MLLSEAEDLDEAADELPRSIDSNVALQYLTNYSILCKHIVRCDWVFFGPATGLGFSQAEAHQRSLGQKYAANQILETGGLQQPVAAGVVLYCGAGLRQSGHLCHPGGHAE